MYENYPVETKKCIEVPRMTLTDRLQQERSNLSARLAEIYAVLKSLSENPSVQGVLDLLQKTRCLMLLVFCVAAVGCVTPYKEPSGRYIETAQTEMRSMFGTNQSFARLERCNGPDGWTLFYTEGDFTNCVLLTKADQDEWMHAYSRGSGPEIVGAAIMGGAIGAGAAVSGVNAAAGATASASNTAVQTVTGGRHGRR